MVRVDGARETDAGGPFARSPIVRVRTAGPASGSGGAAVARRFLKPV